jgi:cytochrome bd-type quinol oxidase subunit 2
MAILGVSDLKRYDGPFLGGWHWQALALDVVEATLVVGGSVWLLAWAQRWLTSRAVGLTRVARSAYLAYLLQVPVLISLEIAGRLVPWPAAVKAVVVAAFAVAGSFGLAWFLTHRARGDRSE